MNLSKTKYCKGVQCKKILWLNEYKSEYAVPKTPDSVFKNGNKVGELAKAYLGEDYKDIPYEKKAVMIEKTRKLMKDEPNIITEASFSFDNNFCRVDILKNDLDGVEIYEVKSSTSFYEKNSTNLKEVFLDDVAYQYYVLSSLDLNVKKAYLVCINNKYKLDGELDRKKFFMKLDITEEVKQKQEEVRYNIDMIKKYMAEYDRETEPIKKIGMHCFKPYECDFWEYCTKDLPKPNVFDIKDMQNKTKFKKYYAGKIKFEDLKNDKTIKNQKYKDQIEYELCEGQKVKIDKDAINNFLGKLKYPLCFLDYETIWPPIPVLEGTKPYQQIPFQYSLHILQEDDSLEHKEFLADGIGENMIREFADDLIKKLKKYDGSIIVYNKKFECKRNEEIGVMLGIEDQMEDINNRIEDIMEPFENRAYYTKEMEGSHSLKYVLPALYPDDPELNYDNLDLIHHGGEASEAFENLKDKTPEEQEEIRDSLKKYCELDTYALVKIWERFIEVTK